MGYVSCRRIYKIATCFIFSYEVWYLSFFFQILEKISVSLLSDKSNRCFTWSVCKFMTVSHWVLLRMFQTFVEKVTIHISCAIIFSLRSRRLWDDVEKYGTAIQATDGNIIRRRKDAICVADNRNSSTDTHSYYLILVVFRSNNCYAKAPQYYVIRVPTMPVLFPFAAITLIL